MERTQSVAGECFEPAKRSFTLGRGSGLLFTGRRDAWTRGLEAVGCGHVMRVVARYGVFRAGVGDAPPLRLGSIYIERKYDGTPIPHYRAVVAPDAAAPGKFRGMGLRFAGCFERGQVSVEHDQVPEALRLVRDYLRRVGLAWELDGRKPGDTEPGGFEL